jgi:putative PIN family toxin of toxin-antitoxin system
VYPEQVGVDGGVSHVIGSRLEFRGHPMGCLLCCGVVRVVLDTSVIVAALRRRDGASNGLLRLVAGRRLTPLATPALFLEYEDVLRRPQQRDAHGLNDDQLDRFLAAFASSIEPVTVHISWRPQLKDPADEMVFDAAVNGRAEALVTFNRKDFADAALKFALAVKRPSEILEGFK